MRRQRLPAGAPEWPGRATRGPASLCSLCHCRCAWFQTRDTPALRRPQAAAASLWPARRAPLRAQSPRLPVRPAIADPASVESARVPRFPPAPKQPSLRGLASYVPRRLSVGCDPSRLKIKKKKKKKRTTPGELVAPPFSLGGWGAAGGRGSPFRAGTLRHRHAGRQTAGAGGRGGLSKTLPAVPVRLGVRSESGSQQVPEGAARRPDELFTTPLRPPGRPARRRPLRPPPRARPLLRAPRRGDLRRRGPDRVFALSIRAAPRPGLPASLPASLLAPMSL